MQKYKAIIFDLDDTLYKEIEYILSGFRAVDNWITENSGNDGFYETATRIFFLGEKRKVFDKTLEQLNLNVNENIISELLEVYRTHEPKIHLLEDADWVINNLIDTIKIGLISDGYLISQQNKVKALKINEKFNTVILTDKFGRDCWKPSPFPYETTVMELGINHNECIYVGDNENKDFITAKRLGWTTVHIERDDGIYTNSNVSEIYKADFKIKDLKDLSGLQIFKELFINN